MSRRKQTDAAIPASVKKLRCAVYTRKSTDEGLDKEFNTLDAQREACESYIASQRAEGWVLVRDRYDDGGFSGGTLDRPALKRLLADIEQGRIDNIVVYKVDRLSRSLMDFAKLVETMEAHGVTFVSVTQSFSTTTSMGRLTLNMLLSFAQYERELIGERIRDKFAASRARGMWMGGKVPLGYDVVARKLIASEDEAPRVRRVFELFVETGSGVEVVRRLHVEGVTAKSGRLLDKGDVYKILNLRTYIGEVTHKGNVYRGEHEAIVPRDLWDRAHAILQVSPRTRAAQNRQHVPALLKGLIVGTDGRALSPTYCRKGGRLYRYYVAQRVLKADTIPPDHIVRRVSAAQIEGAVIGQVRALLRQPEIVAGTWLAARKELPDLNEREVRDSLDRLDPMWGELFPAEQARIVRTLVDRVVVGPDGADIRLRVEGMAGLVRDLGVNGAGALQEAV
jgi:DNA invertase Pin-like site-specific DNA recombinase